MSGPVQVHAVAHDGDRDGWTELTVNPRASGLAWTVPAAVRWQFERLSRQWNRQQRWRVSWVIRGVD